MRACKELSIKSAAVFSEADRGSLHVQYADEAYCLGPAEPSQSYLNIPRIIEMAETSGSEAIHPGYGFLSQIPEFALQCEQAKIHFIGPSSQTLAQMGNKLAARRKMEKAGLQVIPGSAKTVEREADVEVLAEELGFPILIKAVFGGGGRGLRVARNGEDIRQALEMTKLEAEASFGNAQLYVEKLLEEPRHIEFQVLADNFGKVVHLGERECSIQRKHQKLLEETPSPIMSDEVRASIGKKAVEAVEAINYVNAGTVEFLVNKKGDFFFLEMNTRLQVEHLITELVTGIDIVKDQIRIAAGEELSYRQTEITMNGHALNCRINAEDPSRNFAPSPGKIVGLHLPGGPGVRVDTALHLGCEIPLFYDSLIAKVAVWGRDRLEAISRMTRALDELSVEGVKTTTPLLRKILTHDEYKKGRVHTDFVEDRMSKFGYQKENRLEQAAILSVTLAQYLSSRGKEVAVIPLRNRKQMAFWKTAGRPHRFLTGDFRWAR
jgi:acetyl-CoA carboxylase biotin carboxylase subunit